MPNADFNLLADRVLDCAFKVHRTLGPGLFESVYQACFAQELKKNGISVQCALGGPIIYDGTPLDCGFRLEMMVEGLIIIENKPVEALHPVHAAQLLTYLRLSQKELGYLINWNVPLLENGIKRLVNDT